MSHPPEVQRLAQGPWERPVTRAGDGRLVEVRSPCVCGGARNDLPVACQLHPIITSGESETRASET